MRYIMLITGKGEGCDYTIACNKDFIEFQAGSHGAAVEKCREKLTEEGTEFIGSIQLFSVADEIKVPLSKWVTEIEGRDKKDELDAEIAETERRLRELRAKKM